MKSDDRTGLFGLFQYIVSNKKTVPSNVLQQIVMFLYGIQLNEGNRTVDEY